MEPFNVAQLKSPTKKIPFAEADACRKELQREFESTFQTTKLPDRPDYERANVLVDARRRAIEEQLL